MVEGVSIPNSPTERSYTAFAHFQSRIANTILQRTPEEIAQLVSVDGSTTLETLIVDSADKHIALRGERAVQAAQLLRTYAQREHAIQNWWETEQGQGSDTALKRKILQLTNHGQDIEITDDELEDIHLKRIHGGIGVIVDSPVYMQKLGIVSGENIYTRDPADGSLQTTHITDSTQLQNNLAKEGEVGFVLDDQELSLPEELKGMKIVFGTENAMAHEEAEILGMYIDEATETMRQGNSAFQRLEQSHLATTGEQFMPSEQTRLALFDFAARLEEGHVDISLPLLGITPEYAQTHQKEAAILTTIIDHVKKTIAKVDDNTGTASEKIQEEREGLAREIRGAILHPVSLIELWYPDTPTETVLQNNYPDSSYFVENTGSSKTFLSDKKGRFVYYKRSLHKRKPGEALQEQVNAITINGTQYEIVTQLGGGMGDVYVAKDATGNKIVLKEVDYSQKEWLGYIFSETVTMQGAENLYNHWKNIKKAQHSSTPPNPFEFMRLLLPSTRDGTINSQDFKEQIKIAFKNAGLDKKILTQTGEALWDEYSPLYMNARLTAFGFTETDPRIQQHYSLIESAMLQGIVKFSELHQSVRQKQDGMNQYDINLYREAMFLRVLGGIPGVPKFVGWVTGTEGKNKLSPYYNHYYLAMEFIDGESLFAKLASLRQAHRRLTDDQVYKYADKIGQTLSLMHRRGIIFRDLKPGNIMITPTEDAVLIDVGIAVAIPGTPAEQMLNTAPNQEPLIGTNLLTSNYYDNAGTQGFAPPEQYNSSITKPQEPTSDVYAYGAVLFTMLCPDNDLESHPFPLSAEITLRLQKHGVSQEKINVVVKAMELSKKDRYATVDEMRRDLAHAFGKPIPAMTPPLTPTPTQQLTQPLSNTATTRLPIPSVQAQTVISSLDHVGYPTPIRSLQVLPLPVSQALHTITSLPTTTDVLNALAVFGDKENWKNSPALRDLSPMLATQEARNVIQRELAKASPDPRWFGVWGKLLATAASKQPSFVDIPQHVKNDEVQAFFTSITQAANQQPALVNDLVTQLQPLLTTTWFTDFPEHKRGLTLALSKILYTAVSNGQLLNENTLSTLESAMTTNSYLGVTSSYMLPPDVKGYFEIVRQLVAQKGSYPWLKSHLQHVLLSRKDWHLYRYIEQPLEQITSSI